MSDEADATGAPEDIPMSEYPPITRRMIELQVTMNMENAEKGEVSEIEALRNQILIQGNMFTYAITLLEVRLNKLLTSLGYDIQDHDPFEGM